MARCKKEHKLKRTDCDLGHDCYSLPKEVEILMVWLCAECLREEIVEGREFLRLWVWTGASLYKD